MRELMLAVAFVIAALLVVVGLWLIYPPVALIAAGGFVAGLAYLFLSEVE